MTEKYKARNKNRSLVFRAGKQVAVDYLVAERETLQEEM